MQNPLRPLKDESDRLAAGDTAIVTDGSFAGISAAIVKVIGDNAEVEIDVSGKTVAVRLPLQWLERKDDEKPSP